MSQSASITKLSKDNYDTWKLQIEAILIKNDLWDYVVETETIPDDDDERSKWMRADKKARADIILSICPSELYHVKHCETSNEVWTKLKSVYESKGPAKKATLLKQLLFRKMTENENMLEHVNLFFDTVDKLQEMDIDIADDLKSILLLYSIPDHFENFRCAIESRDELPKPEILKIKIIEEWEARKQKNYPDPQKAYYSSDKKRNQKPKVYTDNWKSKQHGHTCENPFRNLKCNYCSKVGHKASECRKKIADRRAALAKQEATMIAETHEEHANSATVLPLTQSKKTSWCLDSGATSHMCNDESLFLDIRKQTNSFVHLAVDKTAEIVGKGTVRIAVSNGTEIKTIRLENVLCVPDLKSNLLSTSKATTKNRSVVFTEQGAKVFEQNGTVLLNAKSSGDLYLIEPSVETAAVVTDLQEWHQKYGHLNETDLKKLQTERMVRGMSFKSNDSLKDCKICIQSKQSAKPFSKESNFKSKQLLDLIHSDVCGPMRVPSLGGSRYFVTFIDNKTRYVEICFLKTKDEVKGAFQKFKAAVENRVEQKIKTLRTDNGLEYCGVEFNKFLEEQGIRREKSAVLTPQQNGIAERMNRTIVEMARCLLVQSKLPASFWAEAIKCAVFLRNRSPTRSISEHETPYEMFFGDKPNVSYLKVFGQKAYVLNKRLKGKFDPRSHEHIFVGYSEESKAYRLWDKQAGRIITSRDVRFIDEFENNLPNNEEADFYSCDTEVVYIEGSSEKKTEQTQTETPLIDVEEVTSDSDTGDASASAPPQLTRAAGRPRKIKSGKPGRPRKEYNMVNNQNNETVQFANSENSNPTVAEALNSSYQREWKKAMCLEYDALVKEKAWELVPRPEHKKVINSKWVLKTKYKPDGSIEKFKARLVAKGCAQTPGIDYEETFSPVARLSSIRTALAYGIEKGLKAYQIDFVMAYINGDLSEEIYMEIPEGFQDTIEGNQVCLLKRSLYGLKQSGRQWYDKLDKKLKSLGFKPLKSDKCVYHKKSQDTEVIIIVYVDDLIVLADSAESYNDVKNSLSDAFKMKDMGQLHYCLGIEFEQEDDSISMSQRKYLEDTLQKFNMQNAKPISTPMDSSVKLTKEMSPQTESEQEEMKEIPYRSLIGTLMYLAIATRPDITYAVNFLSQFNSNPGKAHWIAAKRILRYLKGTQDQKLVYKRNGEPLIGYVDADWASDVNDRKSHTGYVFKFAGGAITWESRKQRSVALSTTEAEYMALTEAAKETVHLRRFFNELSSDIIRSPTTILCDNQSAQKLVRNPVYHSRTKHIDIRYHFIRDICESGEIQVKYISTNDMSADVLTKGLGSNKHKACCNSIGLLH